MHPQVRNIRPCPSHPFRTLLGDFGLLCPLYHKRSYFRFFALAFLAFAVLAFFGAAFFIFFAFLATVFFLVFRVVAFLALRPPTRFRTAFTAPVATSEVVLMTDFAASVTAA